VPSFEAVQGIDPAQWAAAIGINIVAVARLTFLLLPVMLLNKWGRIVNVSSGIAAQPAGMPRANAYATPGPATSTGRAFGSSRSATAS
jgi:NAD(P)-dependent dehydrogenase (short-subunit alcohol dehydrogenase family)